MSKKELAKSVYQRIKKLNLPVKMDGPWITLDAPNVPTDILIDMALCNANELARLAREDAKP